MHLVARGQSNGHENVVVIDEFPGETIDRCRSASRHYPQARHAPQGGLGMKLLGREGLDVPLGQSSSVNLTTRIKALVRRIIRSREPNDCAIVVNSCDAARSAHGQTPARRCSIGARVAPGAGQFSRSIEASGSRIRRIFFAPGWLVAGAHGSPCSHEGCKRPIPRNAWHFSKGTGAVERPSTSTQTYPKAAPVLSNCRASPRTGGPSW